MLELIYHTTVFGPIHFDYSGPIVRVGRSEDNDLVLRHPSVEPHHCLLLFREEKVYCLPPDALFSTDTDWWDLAGPEYGAGDEIRIGELRLSLAHSNRSVAIPEVRRQDERAGFGEPGPRVGPGAGTRTPEGYFCPHCQAVVPEARVRRVGLVGHPKRYLCPRCSTLLYSEESPPAPVPQRRKRR